MKHGIYFFDCSILTTAIQDFTAVIREDPSNAQARYNIEYDISI